VANDLVNIKEDAAPTKKLASQSFVRGADTGEFTLILKDRTRVVHVSRARDLD
jgi:hypothetical protein